MQPRQAERSHRQALEALLPKCPGELERGRKPRPAAKGREQAHPLVAQAPDRELQHEGGSSVEPLDVIESDHHGSLRRESTQRIENGDADRTLLRRLPAGIREPERDLERAAARWRERACDFLQDRFEQIGEPGEGQRCLGLDPAMDEHTIEAPLGLLDTELPEHGLADSRLTGENESLRTVLELGQERLDCHELVLPADHRGRHQASTLSRLAASPARRTPSLR